MANITVPKIPTRNVKFENETLQFEYLTKCAYKPRVGFIGGVWKKAHIKNYKGEPAWIKLDGEELVVEKLVNSLVEKFTGNLVGGKIVEIARFNINE